MCISFDLIYKLLIVCISFDGLFSNVIIPLNYLKYFLMAILIFFIIVRNNYRLSFPFKNFFLKLYVLIIVLTVIKSISFFMNYGFAGIEIPAKYLFFVISLICFNYTFLFGISNQKLLQFFAKTELVWSIINPILFFLRPSILKASAGQWAGRITVGYPTIDVVLYAIAIAVFLFDHENQKNYKKRVLASVILIIGTFLQASGTGAVLVFMEMCFLLFTLMPVKTNQAVKYRWRKIMFLLMLVGAGFLSAITYLQRYDKNLLDDGFRIIENRAAILLGNENKVNYNTLDFRQNQLQLAQYYYQNTPNELFWGAGFGPLNYKDDRDKSIYKSVFLENQFHLFLFTTGFFGLTTFSLLVLSMAIKIVKTRNIMLTCIFTVLITAFYTSLPLRDFSLTFLLGLSIIRVKEEGTSFGLNDYKKMRTL